MKLSLIFELLLIFVLLAFAASKSIKKQQHTKKGINNRNDANTEDASINKFCKCTEGFCNCCRYFQVPVVNLQGPGCASLRYLNGDKMSVSLSFGKKVITNRTLSGRKPSPVCMPLPGGISKFCGRVYNIARTGEDFRACLGLELQAKSTVEAALRVQCFRFGPRGVTSEPADPLPLVPQDEKVDEDDDDDDDEDDFGLGDVADDDDDDDDEDDDDGEIDAVNDVESADYTGFSLLGEDLLGDFFGTSGNKKPSKNKRKQAPIATTSTTTTRRPRPTRRPIRVPARTTTPRTSATRTTTVRVRPVRPRPTRQPGSRRPIRPRPNRKPTTVSSAEVPTASITTITTTTMSPTRETTENLNHTTELLSQLITDKSKETSLEPVSIVTQTPSSTTSLMTPKSVTNFMDSGLEMSLADITGQLSIMPVTEIVHNAGQFAPASTINDNEINYEKIKTITPKAPTTIAMSSSSEVGLSDDMVQIVQSLDSQSEESVTEQEPSSNDESRSYLFNYDTIPAVISNNYEGLSLPKKKHKNNGFNLEDLDFIGLTDIGETVGDELGVFHKKNKRQNRDKKVNKVKKGNNDYEDLLGLDLLGETLGLGSKNNKNKKDRRRENKMMRGDWAQV